MRFLPIFLLFLSLFFIVTASVFSFPYQSGNKTLIKGMYYSVESSADNNNVMYLASENSVYNSENKGKTWRKVYVTRANKRINRIMLDNNNSNNIYLATQDGLYYSNNKGSNWKKIFSGRSDLENDCLSIYKLDNNIYLGTKEGLFLSVDNGKEWTKLGNQFSESVISSIISNPQNGIIYIACEKGIYMSTDPEDNWIRIYFSNEGEISSEDYPDDDLDFSDKTTYIKRLYISLNNPERLYALSAKSIVFTDDEGSDWQKLNCAGLPANINSISSFKNGDIIVVTNDGVFRLKGGYWQRIDTDSKIKDANDIFIDKEDNIFVASSYGLYKVSNCSEADSTRQNGIVSEININELLQEDPSITDVQKAAIEYADVDIRKIKSWDKQSRLKALIPEFSVSYGRSVYGSSNGTNSVGPRDVSTNFSWNVADLIWSTDITSIDSRSRLTVQLRQDVLEQVSYLYYERQRIKAELILTPPSDPQEKISRYLVLYETTANLDGMTNGYFSKHCKKAEKKS